MASGGTFPAPGSGGSWNRAEGGAGAGGWDGPRGEATGGHRAVAGPAGAARAAARGESGGPGWDDEMSGTAGGWDDDATAPGGWADPAGPADDRWDAGAVGDSYADDAYGDDAYYDEDELDDEDDLPRRRGCRAAVIVLLVLVVAVLAAGWFGWSWLQDKIDPPGGPGEVVLVEVPEGTSTSGIGDIMADAGVISDAGVWSWYTKVNDVGTIQAGSYEMRLNSSFDEAIADLENDPLPPNSELVTVPEGLTQSQIAARLVDPETGVEGFTEEGVAAALADPAARSAFLPTEQTSLEGTLYPETYAVLEDDTEADVIQRLTAQFDEVMTELGAAERAAALEVTPYEAVIVASMVERESGTPADAPKVARVIYNRLAAGEPLGVDATSCYEEGGVPCELTTEMLTDGSDYDTRDQPGLPPTPIASPGEVSLEAALAPAEGDWRWYVLDVEAGDGSSFFTDDYDEFVAAKARCESAGQCG